MIGMVFEGINRLLEWIYKIIYILLLVMGSIGLLAHYTLMKADSVLHSKDIDYSKIDMVRYLGD